MKIVHRIIGAKSNAYWGEFTPLGIVFDESAPLIVFEIDESNPIWPSVNDLIGKYKILEYATAVFSKEEIEAAEWLELSSNWYNSYPQPEPGEGDFGYLEETYDFESGCEKCGIGFVQKAPFRLKTAPKWGRRSVFILNWVFDEIFCTPELWEAVFSKKGIGCREVHNKKREVLPNVVQLVFDELVDLKVEGLEYEDCKTCGQRKYTPVTAAPSPQMRTRPAGHGVKSRQYFGSGGSAFRLISISQDLAKALRTENLRGAVFKPVQD